MSGLRCQSVSLVVTLLVQTSLACVHILQCFGFPKTDFCCVSLNIWIFGVYDLRIFYPSLSVVTWTHTYRFMTIHAWTYRLDFVIATYILKLIFNVFDLIDKWCKCFLVSRTIFIVDMAMVTPVTTCITQHPCSKPLIFLECLLIHN